MLVLFSASCIRYLNFQKSDGVKMKINGELAPDCCNVLILIVLKSDGVKRKGRKREGRGSRGSGD